MIIRTARMSGMRDMRAVNEPVVFSELAQELLVPNHRGG